MGERPVPLKGQAAVTQGGGVGWGKLGDLGEDGPVGRRVPEGHVVMQSLPVQAPGYRGVAQQGLDLGGKEEETVPAPVIERLLPHPVPGQEEAAPTRVPDREGEHPSECVDTLVAHLLVEMDDNLAIGPALESVPLRLEISP